MATVPAAAADPTGTITGLVTSSTGTPVADAMVGLWTPGEDAYEATVDTDGSGIFTFTGVPVDDYLVHVYGTGDSPGTYHPSAASEHEATLVTAVANATVSADVAMASASSISGKVTGPSGQGIRVEIELRRQYQAGCASCWEYVGDSLGTNSTGAYVFSRLQPGTYRIRYLSDQYQDEYYKDAHSFAAATNVVVDEGQKRTGIDARLDAGGEITGSVRDSSGAPAADVRVSAYDDAGDVWRTDSTAADGRYRIVGLPSGTYELHASEFDGRYDSARTTRSLIAPQIVLNQNFTLNKLSRISGIVTGFAGSRADGGTLIVHRRTAQNTWVQVDRPFGDWIEDNGSYSLHLPPGTYRVQAWGARAGTTPFGAKTFFGGSTSLEGASDLVLGSGGQSLTGKNIQLVQGASLSGTVSVPSGPVYAGVRVVDTTTDEVVSNWAQTNAGGVYTIHDIPPGTYRVEFEREFRSSPRAAQYYEGVPESAGPAAATEVILTAGQTRTGVNAALVLGSTLTGRLVRSDGSDAAGCYVSAFTPDETLSTRAAETAADGTFTIGGLSAGAYSLKIDAGGGYAADAWACLGEPNPNRPEWESTEAEVYPEPRFYSAENGELSSFADSLRTVTVPASGTTALPVTLSLSAGTPIVGSTPPSISGTARAGAKLTASPGTWAPSDVQASYQWKVGGVDAGTGAPTYVPMPQDVGKKVTVVVTVRKTGHATTSATSPATASVAAPVLTLTSTSAPRITGTTRVGSVLRVDPGAWSLAGVTHSYVWRRNGSVVAGRVRSTYTLGPADLGKRISVTVRASAPGVAPPATRLAASPAVVRRGLLHVGSEPKISGTTAVGSRLRTTRPACTPAATVSVQWLRGGVAVRGATGVFYRLTPADRGHRISVRVTYTRIGFGTVRRVSHKTTPVR